MTTTADQPNLFLRNDTLLGICEGLGTDLGIHPNLLRIALALAFYFNPPVVVGTYLGLGVIVAASRYAFPDRVVSVEADTAAVANDETELKLAA